MATYLMLGRYSAEGVKGISAQRSDKARALVRENGGELKAVYALLGDYDLAALVDLPDTERAIKLGVALNKLLGVSFSTLPAITIEEFDKLVG